MSPYIVDFVGQVRSNEVTEVARLQKKRGYKSNKVTEETRLQLTMAKDVQVELSTASPMSKYGLGCPSTARDV